MSLEGARVPARRDGKLDLRQIILIAVRRWICFHSP